MGCYSRECILRYVDREVQFSSVLIAVRQQQRVAYVRAALRFAQVSDTNSGAVYGGEKCS